jgi:hypothetical protein
MTTFSWHCSIGMWEKTSQYELRKQDDFSVVHLFSIQQMYHKFRHIPISILYVLLEMDFSGFTFHVILLWDIHSHKTNQQHYTDIYHIFCCNMFVFACPIIARSQCWLFALKYPYFPPNSTSGIWAWYGSLRLIPWPIWKMSCNNLLILFKVE